MLELARDLLPLLRSGVAVAAVTVTRVARSAPRGIGATMAVTASGQVIGSISGGCVEGDAVLLGHQARLTGRAHTARLGFSDEAAHAAGLACGGSVDVAAYPVQPDGGTIAALEAVASGGATTIGVVVSGPDSGSIVDERMLRRTVADELIGPLLTDRRSHILPEAYNGADILLVSSAAPPRLILIGAGEHAAAVCRVAAASGFAVEVCDVWPALLTAERFPDAVRLVPGLPHEHLAALGAADIDGRTAICVLSHDERIDVPALRVALTMPVGFIGAMGARSTVARRAALLRECGVTDADIARVHSPLGLDLGGSTPDETALSVLAEIVAARHGGSGAPLGATDGPLHRRAAPSAGAAPAQADASVVTNACTGSALPHPALHSAGAVS